MEKREGVKRRRRRWCDGRGKICLVDMAHSGKYSQMDKAWKGGREGVGKHDRRKNLKLSVWIFFIGMRVEGVWLLLVCLSKEIGG